MKKSILLFCTIISFVITCQAQKSLCTISGVVTDAEDRPVPNVAVFIPFTSNWCTTNAEGEYSLKGLQPGPIELSFRHLSFESLTKSILVQPVKNMSLNVQLKTTRIELTEVVKMASPAKQRFGLEQFTRYVLSDGYGRSCKINNPQDLEFYWEEDRLVGQASKPLEIINNYLGYNIKYYLDYFWFEEKKLLPDDPHTHILFAFSGSALYEDRLENNWMRKSGWENNRSKEFRGTLRHFLQCLYDGQLDACGYVVKEAWMNEKEFQKAKKLSPAVAYARFHEMNKLFYLNPLVTEASYLHYEPQINLMIKALETDSAADTPVKVIEAPNTCLVFFYLNQELDAEASKVIYFDLLPDDPNEIPTLQIDYFGNYEIRNGTILWDYLDNQTNLYNAMPADYIGRAIKE